MKRKPYTQIALIFLISLSCPFSIFSQSAPNLVSDITWDSDPNTSGNQSTATTLAHIENAFNNARRQEEIQKVIPTNSLGILILPINWSTYTILEKSFFLINAERNCRGGIDYDGNGAIQPILGLSIEQVETQLNTIAQNHANWLVANNLFQHIGANNSTPFTRIQAVFGLNACSEFLSRGENIAYFASSTTTITAAVEKAVYNWIYKDSGSQWGHREACLLQDQDLSGSSSNGFKNNYGGMLSEGMLGIGLAGANNNAYNPFGLTGMNRSEVVVMMVMDPVTDATATVNNCNFAAAVSLPIELTQFVATQDGEQIALHWKTATERDNSHFIIERASNTMDFEPIGRVEGWGNSTTERSYAFMDKKVASGTHYYRLVQYDNSGKTTTSRIIAIRFFEKLNLSTYVNNDNLQVAFTSSKRGTGIFHVIDLNGMVLEKGAVDIESGFNRIDKTMELPSGIYFLTLEVNGIKEINKFFWSN